MNDVERVFRRLVDVLSAREPGLLQEPLEVADLYQNIIPYRAHRAALRFDTNQDYEMALLRLLSGEQGLIEVEPPAVAEALAAEARSINPHPGAFRNFSEARVRLSLRAVREILDARNAFAPPDATAVARPEAAAAPAPRELPFALEPAAPAPTSCPQCSRHLPTGRAVTFCPHCGGSVKVRDCPQCGTQLELEWRHCVACGHRCLIKEGKDFTAVSLDYSSAPSLGKVERGQLMPDVEKKIFSMNIGDISDPVEVADGLYIFKLVDQLPAQTLPIENIKDKITDDLSKDKFKKEFTSWIAKLKKDAYIEIKK